jgi:hypothetical protein
MRTLKPIKTHGTDSGYQAHKRRGEDPCPACRAARNAYMVRYRATHEADYEQEKRLNAARSRALWRLANAHPDEFRAYFDEERAPTD